MIILFLLENSLIFIWVIINQMPPGPMLAKGNLRYENFQYNRDNYLRIKYISCLVCLFASDPQRVNASAQDKGHKQFNFTLQPLVGMGQNIRDMIQPEESQSLEEISKTLVSDKCLQFLPL